MPPFLRNTGKGWVTAEYGMLPRATNTRMTARGDGRQGRRPHAGDPAAHRPVAPLGHEPAGARRAHDLDRLRRHPGRRRHADGVDHRRVRRAGARAREAARARRDQDDARSPTTSPPRASASSTASAARPGVRRRLARRSRHEHRQDGRRPVHRGAGDGRGDAVRPRRAARAARPGRRRASASSSRSSARSWVIWSEPRRAAAASPPPRAIDFSHFARSHRWTRRLGRPSGASPRHRGLCALEFTTPTRARPARRPAAPLVPAVRAGRRPIAVIDRDAALAGRLLRRHVGGGGRPAARHARRAVRAEGLGGAASRSRPARRRATARSRSSSARPAPRARSAPPTAPTRSRSSSPATA